MENITRKKPPNKDPYFHFGFNYPIIYKHVGPDLVVCNLVKTKLFYSWGTRTCPGKDLMLKHFIPITEEIRKYFIIKSAEQFDIKLPISSFGSDLYQDPLSLSYVTYLITKQANKSTTDIIVSDPKLYGLAGIIANKLGCRLHFNLPESGVDWRNHYFMLLEEHVSKIDPNMKFLGTISDIFIVGRRTECSNLNLPMTFVWD